MSVRLFDVDLWKPIATATKDGTGYLVTDGSSIFLAWNEGDGWFEREGERELMGLKLCAPIPPMPAID